MHRLSRRAWDEFAGSGGVSDGQIPEYSGHRALGLTSRLDSRKGEGENARETLRFLA